MGGGGSAKSKTHFNTIPTLHLVDFCENDKMTSVQVIFHRIERIDNPVPKIKTVTFSTDDMRTDNTDCPTD